MLNILADSLLIALRMGAPSPHHRDNAARSHEPAQRRKPADQRA